MLDQSGRGSKIRAHGQSIADSLIVRGSMADLFDVRGELAGEGSFLNHARLESNYISFLSIKYSYTFHFRPQPREITQILKYDDNIENLNNWTQCDGQILHGL